MEGTQHTASAIHTVTCGISLHRTDAKRKVHPRTGHEGQEGEEGILALMFHLSSALDVGGWSTPRPGRFTPGKDPVPIVQEAGLATEPVWTGAENLAPTGIRSRTVQPVASRHTTALSQLPVQTLNTI
jgi:hypothetical protein